MGCTPPSAMSMLAGNRDERMAACENARSPDQFASSLVSKDMIAIEK